MAAFSGSRCDRSVPGNWTDVGKPKKTDRDTKRRNAGAGRQPWHREVRSALTRALEEARAGLLGLVRAGPAVAAYGTRVTRRNPGPTAGTDGA